MRNALHAVALAAFVSLSAPAVARAQNVPAAPSVALVNNRQLMLRRRNPDGSLAAVAPFTIKGVDWSPASRGTNTSKDDPNNANVRRPEFATWAATDIPLLKAMNVNTVRLFIDPGADSSGRAVMDELYRNGIMVIMTVDDAVNNTARAQQVVGFYRDHPAVLMWSLGSEWNINRYFFVASSTREAAQRTETAAALIKALDPNHPVATSYGELEINAPGATLADTADYVNNVCRSVDVWGLNIYRGNSFGTLFAQWKTMTGKPMYIGEFGADAWRTPGAAHTLGVVDELMQAQWDSILWNELAKNLSATDPSKVALGGTVFASNDEWWKVSPAGSQQTDGFQLANAQPDDFFNEEFFGLLDIDRHTRRAYDSFKILYAPGAQPTRTALFRAASRGTNAFEPGTLGAAHFFDRGRRVFRTTGGAGGGRGFNVLAVDPSTAQPLGPVQTFDTWASRTNGDAHAALISYLDGLPAGTLVLLAVCDEAGLTQFDFDSCRPLSFPWTENLYRALEALGARSIRQYCYRDSWAMAAFKGQGQAVEESLSHNEVEANASASVALTSSVQFASAHASAGEAAGSVQLTVTRTGDLSDEASVSYRTADQTADERTDYDAARGTLRFAPGEQTKTVSVPLVNDVRVEPDETFNVLLESPAGATLGTPSAATVTINSDDATPPAPGDNPSDGSQFFARMHYVDFLNREPDAPGLAFWTSQIESCGTGTGGAQCREVRRVNVSAAFFLSIEFQQTGYLVYRLHHLAFNTAEALRLPTFLADTQEIGRGVVVNQGDWERQLEANRQEFVDRFVARAEFEAALPSSLTPAQYVDTLNSRTADPAPSQPSPGPALTQAERDQLVADLVAGRRTRAQVLRAVAENGEFRRRQFNKAFVLMQYFGYLRRNPNDPPDADFVGYNFWLSKLEQFRGDFVRAEMVKAFISSTEYRQRFGPA